MITNARKAEVIFELAGAKNDPACKIMLNLLDILVDEARKANDDADVQNFQRNQGEIKGYMRLKEYIERGIPSNL